MFTFDLPKCNFGTSSQCAPSSTSSYKCSSCNRFYNHPSDYVWDWFRFQSVPVWEVQCFSNYAIWLKCGSFTPQWVIYWHLSVMKLIWTYSPKSYSSWVLIPYWFIQFSRWLAKHLILNVNPNLENILHQISTVLSFEYSTFSAVHYVK